MYAEHADLPAWNRAVWSDDKRTLMNPEAPNRWSAAFDPPPVGARVRATINNLGPGVVLGYFTEDGWLGVRVRFDDPPAWFLSQKGNNVPGCLFGPELEIIA